MSGANSHFPRLPNYWKLPQTLQPHATATRSQSCVTGCSQRRIRMQTPDDEKFETYLRRFDPISPEPIPTLTFGYASRRSLRLTAALAGFAILLVVVAADIFHTIGGRQIIGNMLHETATTETREPMGPLTLKRANSWLATSSSFKAAIDDLAFRHQSRPFPNGKQSAIEVLSKERIKL